jgi:hypothetical protein
MHYHASLSPGSIRSVTPKNERVREESRRLTSTSPDDSIDSRADVQKPKRDRNRTLSRTRTRSRSPDRRRSSSMSVGE